MKHKRRMIFAITLTAVVLITASVRVYAKNWEFHDGVYRGEKWEFEFGKPKKNDSIIMPQDRPKPEVYGNGYVDRIEETEKPYKVILLDNGEVGV